MVLQASVHRDFHLAASKKVILLKKKYTLIMHDQVTKLDFRKSILC